MEPQSEYLRDVKSLIRSLKKDLDVFRQDIPPDVIAQMEAKLSLLQNYQYYMTVRKN